MSNNFAPAVDLSVMDPLIAEELKRDVSECGLAQANSVAYVAAVDIADKGVFTGLLMNIQTCAGVGGTGSGRVWIDGVNIGGCILYYTKKGDSSSNHFNHRFETSLKVEVNISVANDVVNARAPYTTDA